MRITNSLVEPGFTVADPFVAREDAATTATAIALEDWLTTPICYTAILA